MTEGGVYLQDSKVKTTWSLVLGTEQVMEEQFGAGAEAHSKELIPRGTSADLATNGRMSQAVTREWLE